MLREKNIGFQLFQDAKRPRIVFDDARMTGVPNKTPADFGKPVSLGSATGIRTLV